MPTYHPTPIARTMGLMLLTVPLFAVGRPRLRPAHLVPIRAIAAPPASSPSAAARRTARRYWVRAAQAVNSEREVLEEWDPEATENMNQEQWRRQLMAADRTGDLKRALKWGRHAAALARTPEDIYAAARLLDRLECDAGHHEAELAQARKLMALQPSNSYSIILLQRAAVCNHLEALIEQNTPAMRKLGYACAIGDGRSCRE
jgi:hypothetical protein